MWNTATRVDIIRNTAALVFNVRLQAGASTFDYLEIGDAHGKDLEDIVRITKWHKNDDRLDWDLINILHHCSYLSLRPCQMWLGTQTLPAPMVEAG